MLMDSDEPQQPASGEPAGQQLKRARESLGLSLNDVADAQHLRVSIIQAIEDGHYSQIDSELFLKGYVRAYAKQVGADADAIIQTLDLELEPFRRERAKQEQENPLIDIERRRRKKRRVAKALAIIVVLGGIALAGWKLVLEPRMGAETPENTGSEEQPTVGQGSGSDQEMVIDEVPVPDQSPAMADSPAEESAEAPYDSIGTSGSIGSAEVSVTGPDSVEGLAEEVEPAEPEATQAGESPELSGPSGDDNNTMELAGNTSAFGSDTESEEIVAVEPVMTEPEAQPDPVFAESAQPEAVAAPVQLEMSFTSNCWVQITDSSGARLVASLQRNGDEVSVSGRPPLQVVIGAVDAVESVRFAGEPVDLSGFRVVNNRTEFTLTL